MTWQQTLPAYVGYDEWHIPVVIGNTDNLIEAQENKLDLEICRK